MEALYEINWDKYNKLKNYSECCSAFNEFYKKYHNCNDIMLHKKQLEQLVRKYKNNHLLKSHFMTTFKKRKEWFYQKIIYEILWNTTNEQEKEIIEKTKDILFIYSKKREEKDYLECVLNEFEFELSKQESDREYLIEQFRNNY